LGFGEEGWDAIQVFYAFGHAGGPVFWRGGAGSVEAGGLGENIGEHHHRQHGVGSQRGVKRGLVEGIVVFTHGITAQTSELHRVPQCTLVFFDVLAAVNVLPIRRPGGGQAVAEWLLRRPEVARVHYPGLASYPQTGLFRQQMMHGGALLSFELTGGEEAACRFLDRIRLVLNAVSLGGMESLATRPAMSSHRGMTSEARLRAGVSDSLIRLSVGVEALEDLLADLEQAIAG